MEKEYVTDDELGLLVRAEKEGLCKLGIRLGDDAGELVIQWDTEKLRERGIEIPEKGEWIRDNEKRNRGFEGIHCHECGWGFELAPDPEKGE
jgi:hypothetical protein